MSTLDFKEIKASKEGKVTPKALLESALEHIDDKDHIIIVSIDKEGYIKTGYSDGGMVEALGLLEAAKAQMIHEMEE